MVLGVSSLHRLLTHSCPGSLNPYDFQGCWLFNTWIENVGGVHILWFVFDQALPGDDKYLEETPVTAPTIVSRRSSYISHIPVFSSPPRPSQMDICSNVKNHWMARYIWFLWLGFKRSSKSLVYYPGWALGNFLYVCQWPSTFLKTNV